ncbi:hypothetical protein DL240_10045 [Lujinxingia litoralis]|uniref:Uncharacterized protein n=1 Tax=Lujinxingia litoralis TaxID=2211119 RepID=A0A328CAC1_9DELT|nr:hypothetical protein [Lujinxingia litoralis]RAL22187.1 hypothetical protein DL240_10045 [Lujinxingia litoralis]
MPLMTYGTAMNNPGVMEIDSGSYEISLNGVTLGYGWFTLDTFNNRTAYFVAEDSVAFPFDVPMGQTLSFERIPVDFTSPEAFGKWSREHLAPANPAHHCIIETQVNWGGI